MPLFTYISSFHLYSLLEKVCRKTNRSLTLDSPSMCIIQRNPLKWTPFTRTNILSLIARCLQLRGFWCIFLWAWYCTTRLLSTTWLCFLSFLCCTVAGKAKKWPVLRLILCQLVNSSSSGGQSRWEGWWVSPKSGSLSIAIRTTKTATPSSDVSAVQGLLKYWSEWKDGRDFQNCPVHRGCPCTVEECLLSGVPLYA